MRYTIYQRIKHLCKSWINKTVPLHQNEEYKPFYIVGSGRAGTTLLRRFLIGQNVHIPPEIWASKVVINKFKVLSWYNSWDTLVRNCVTLLLEDSDFDNSFKSRAYRIITDLKKIDRNQRSLAYLINYIYKEHAKWLEMDIIRWGDKTPLNSYALSEIESVFPDVKFIHLIRDGVDVINSYLENDMVQNLESGSRRWKTAVQEVKGFRSNKPTKVLEVRYEDLVNRSKYVTKRICRYLDIPFNTNMVQDINNKSIQDLRKHDHHQNIFKDVTNKFIGKGRRAFEKEDLKKLAPIINDQLVELGYKPI